MSLAQARSARGDLVLRRRDDGALELRANGVFVMDTLETSSERALATASLAAVTSPRRVLLAGLGLGFTLQAVLADSRVEHVRVVELEAALVSWLHDGLVPSGPALLDDPRVSVAVVDIADAVAQTPPGTYDVVLLDVDNGPDFLVHDANARLYRAPFLRRCLRLLTGAGVLVVWSMNRSTALVETMASAGGVHVRTQACPVRLGSRDETYWLHLASAG